ncbi:hypothetical protein KAW18_03775 [candidate division WOR-3 bacterium]|nr:hypothetical protein [Candidatus Parcubacteria bacterium]MCK4526466.1 hypothetical protein [candidate division WOR-3 bacterium]
MSFNVNSYDTDLVDLDPIILDLNILEVARIVTDGDTSYGLLLLKNGHVHTVELDVVHKLKGYCRQK